ncbi:fatty-acyl-CoA synthase [Actinocorallia herbida]|uniref:Fatty-acyl-CoA synthase n=1 Tax=Actinocorallia herbida TaxID=58109 RepID=A0A3N1D2F7_9ACTN|nr:AMP-binding protein [Actinocorallia herbida]ROO87715.1 fatty-acyl-CoA synthase [Actinocorallia herbida]
MAFRTYVESVLGGLAPEGPVLVADGVRFDAVEFRALVYRMARALWLRGVHRGVTVTLLSGNLAEAIAARYAVNLLGAHYNHLYNRLAPDVQARMMRDVETTVLIVDPNLAERVARLAELAPVKLVLVLGPAGDGAPGEDLLALAAEQDDAPHPSLAEPGDLCFIRHSGGTTGHPKGVRSTFERTAFDPRMTAMFAGDAPRDLVCTPISHAAGFLADFALAAGGTVHLHYTFDPAEILATIERERITHMMLLSPLLYQLLDHPGTADTSSLKQITYGGTPSSPVRIAQAVRRFGRIFQHGYGQFEAGAISVLPAAEHDPDDLDVLRTAGRLVPGVKVEIRDTDGKPLPSGEVGEICARGPQMMEGYWKDPELTATTLVDGWILTGDLGRLDAGGYLTVVDRAKDMIAVVGGHVYTTELEEFLSTHHDVRHSAVYGVRGEDGIERVHITVVLAPGSSTTADDLRALIRDGRGPMYEPDHVDLTDAIPLTDAGKPDKKELRRRAGHHTP